DEDERKKLPVDTVSWFDCVEFCNNLSEKEGRKPCYRFRDVRRDGSRITEADVEFLADATGYRLPTEAEWEYACRAGTQTAFWWGDIIGTDQANYNGNAYGPGDRQFVYRRKTTPVEFFKPNPWGLYDMHGNLWQWCQDNYALYRED